MALLKLVVSFFVVYVPFAVSGGVPEEETRCAAYSLLDRTVAQDQGAWVLEYRLRYNGETGTIITAEEIGVKVEGWVSNSRVASHALPRWSSLAVIRSTDLTAVTDVISASDEGQRCRERLAVSAWTEDLNSVVTAESSRRSDATHHVGSAIAKIEPAGCLPLSVGPNSVVRVRLRLEHQHILYGDYDPLLAGRQVTLSLGSRPILDYVSLDREQYLAQPRYTWPEPPDERRDTRHSVSGPDSLHLEAHIPGHQYYRYPERPVRYSTTMRLRFSYLVAGGTEGECKVKVRQYKETPVSWRQLNNGSFEHCLKSVGHWKRFERIIETEPDATTLTLEFQIVGETEIGEMWVDDVSLETLGSDLPGGP
jgi:hypothetical protein